MQANKDILLNTMDVFVKEPLLDWHKFAMRLASLQGLLITQNTSGEVEHRGRGEYRESIEGKGEKYLKLQKSFRKRKRRCPAMVSREED